MSTLISTRVEAPDQNQNELICGPPPTDVLANDNVPMKPPSGELLANCLQQLQNFLGFKTV